MKTYRGTKIFYLVQFIILLEIQFEYLTQLLQIKKYKLSTKLFIANNHNSANEKHGNFFSMLVLVVQK